MSLEDEVREVLAKCDPKALDIEEPKSKVKEKAKEDVRYSKALDLLKQVPQPSFAEITRQTKINYAALKLLAQENKISTNQKPPEVFDSERRRKIIDAAFQQVEDLIAVADSGKEIQSLVAALKQLVEMRRLEDGEATERTETTIISEAKDSLAEKLEVIAARFADAESS